MDGLSSHRRGQLSQINLSNPLLSEANEVALRLPLLDLSPLPLNIQHVWRSFGESQHLFGFGDIRVPVGFVTLYRLLSRLHASKTESLMVPSRPEIPLHTTGSENDIRCQVTRRKVSAGT